LGQCRLISRNPHFHDLCLATCYTCNRVVNRFPPWWRWALLSPDGVAPSRIVGVSASVNLPLHHKVQKFSSCTGSPGRSRKKGRKTDVCVCVCVCVTVCVPPLSITKCRIQSQSHNCRFCWSYGEISCTACTVAWETTISATWRVYVGKITLVHCLLHLCTLNRSQGASGKCGKANNAATTSAEL